MRLLGAGLVSAVRGFHHSAICSAVDKQLLSKLRKTTGFPFVNCRKALEKFENDITQAEKWLREQAQKEGWAKATKLQGRPMSQGLIGLIMKEKSAAMIEVNCETDFVARNAKFHSFVSFITDSFLQHGLKSGQEKIVLDSAGFGSLIVEQEDKRSISDLTALEVGNIGENIAVRRGVYMHAASPAHHLSSYVHITGPPLQHSTGSAGRGIHQLFQAGKYGSLMLYRIAGEVKPSADSISVEQLGRHLCQHIVGMNPLSIGSHQEEQSHEQEQSPHSSFETSGGASEPSSEKTSSPAEDETQLLRQEYMLDTSLTVGQVVREHGLEVVDFVRLECGAEEEARGEQQQQHRTEQTATAN